MKELLSAVMPDLEAVPDRHLRVFRRARETRRRRVVAGAAVVVLLALGAVTVPRLISSGEAKEPFAAGASAPCPRTQAQPGRAGDGLLAPRGATSATLCAHQRGEPIGSEREFVVRGTVGEDADSIVDALDALPAPKPGDSCFLSGRPQYLLVLDYPDRAATVVVEVHQGCGRLLNGNVVRGGDVEDPLNAFAEAFREQGGEIAPPPWKW